MKHDMTCAPVDAQTPAHPVTVMQCALVARIDPEPLAHLYAELGTDAAEDTICRVLEDIAERLNTLHSLRCRGSYDQMSRPAKRLRTVAHHIGLTEVATAAEAVGNCAAQGDPVALEATLCRLERGFDAAISQIWDVPAGR